MPDLTFEQLVLLVAVVLACIAAYNTIATARKHRREEQKEREGPIVALREKLNHHDELLASDKRRIDETDERVERIETQSTIILRGVRALLSHEINGNSTEKLQNSMTEIDNYLIDRK